MASLLLIHGLYPVDLETRVREALDSVRPYMESHGGDVELLGDRRDGVARLRLEGQLQTAARRRASTLELAIEAGAGRARARPDGIDVVGLGGGRCPAGAADGAGDTRRGPVRAGRTVGPPGWHALDGASAVADGRLAAETVNGMPLVVANVDGTLLAYRDTCPACGAALHGGELLRPEPGVPGLRDRVRRDPRRALAGRLRAARAGPAAARGRGARVAV